MNPAIKRAIKVLLSLGLAVFATVVGWLIYYANAPLQLPHAPLQFSLKQGSSLRSVAKYLTQIGVLDHPWSLIVLGRALGKAGQIKAGNYELTENLSAYQLLTRLTEGDVTLREIAFIEGWTFSQLRGELNGNPGVRHDSANLSEEDILKRIGATENSAEGLFFPDTYFFDDGVSDLMILKRAYLTMKDNLAAAWDARAKDLPFSDPYEALIMASIVEKETGKATERNMVAAVLINRMRRGMKLQADPTVIYGMGEKFDGNLRKRDLTGDTTYNTYTREGLPPTPIALPGMAAIQATLHPAETKALYFVSRGDGSTVFSNSLEEHNRAVTKYQKGGRHN
ncbi:MAG TPA: endolytic transglycosylase MltG [Burkholderiales bacterium]|nr:endolytic transglycosylase MltG [Burkholderiales bacterium]